VLLSTVFLIFGMRLFAILYLVTSEVFIVEMEGSYGVNCFTKVALELTKEKATVQEVRKGMDSVNFIEIKC